jgi:GT2 family glycosyltransferase
MANGMISIIIVSYNASELLLQCVESCRMLENAQPGSDYEIIIVDNNSTDNAYDKVVKTTPDVTWIQNDTNLGFSTAVNIGLNAAVGDYFLLLNPDSEISPGALLSLKKFWSSFPQAGIVGGKIVNSDGSFQKQCRRNFPRPASAFFRLFKLGVLLPKHKLTSSYEHGLEGIDDLHEVDAVAGAFMCFRRSLIGEIGMFDEGYFLMGEDLDFCYRTKLAGKTVYYYPDAVVTHHHGASRKTRRFRSFLDGHLAMVRYFKKFLREDHSRMTSSLIYTGIFLHFFSLSVFNLCRYPMRRGGHE